MWYTIRGITYLGRTKDAWPLCRRWIQLLDDVHGTESNNRMYQAALFDVGSVALSNGLFDEAVTKLNDHNSTNFSMENPVLCNLSLGKIQTKSCSKQNLWTGR